MKRKMGKVFIVGAGPGAVDLITVRGRDLIESADIILTDALVNPALLRTTKAKIIFAGKRGPGAPHGASVEIPQAKMNQLLVHYAQKGLRVVRLKGGDPLVYGRVGEELEALTQKKIPFEIVPGISSALAAPAYAGIPLTDRRYSSQVTFITGQEEASSRSSAYDLKNVSPHGTCVVLMGVHAWPQLQKAMITRGWASSTPVAAIESATTSSQRIIRSTLDRSTTQFKKNKLVSPAVIVVGSVAKLHDSFHWVKQQLPLLGKKIVLIRAPDQNQEWAATLRERGGDLILCPSLRVVPIKPTYIHLKILKQPMDWVLFLSVNAVHQFHRFYPESARYLKTKKVLAIGPKTAAAIRSLRWNVTRVADNFNSFGVKKAMGTIRGLCILIPRVDKAPALLRNLFEEEGGQVTEMSIYKTEPLPMPASQKNLILKGVDAILFTSSSAARYFLNNFSKSEKSKLFRNAKAISIGPLTTATLKKEGLKKRVESRVSTTEGMTEELCRIYQH